MSNLSAAVGLSEAGRMLDLSTAPVLRERKSALDQEEYYDSFSKAQAATAAVPPAPIIESPAPTSYSNYPPQAPAPASPPPAHAQTQPQNFSAQPTTPSAPPVLPTDTSRVQDRINQLYGRSKTAEERAADLESKLLDLQRRLDEGYRQPAPQPAYQPPHQPYGYEAAPSYNQAPPPGDHVTKAELFQFMKAMQQDNAAQTALANAHTVARLEAEREFPDVYQNPELRATASEIYSRDRALQQDPLGVKKAALMARGLSVSDIRVQAAAAASQSVRKEAMTGMGPTVPAGSGSGPDQSQRLSQALARARQTGRLEDLVYADQIRRGSA